MGVVELTVALHYVFDAPNDVLIWDVGHQAYAHKLLTGRRDKFHTLRQFRGIAGFPRREESPYDAFSTGHSSTSISASLGVTIARQIKKKSGKVIAIIGDGSMTAGMAFEGLNQAGHQERDLIVVLNDNEMSISPNVGALSSFLSRKLSGGAMATLKKEISSFLKSVPGIGDNISNLLKRSEESLKAFITPGMLFQAFKFDYIGPIPGHRLNKLIETLNEVRTLEGPILVHVLTQKGKGYPPAEKDPTYFHGVGEFEVKTGRKAGKPRTAPTYTSVFGETLVKFAEENPDIFAITAAMPEGTGLAAFEKKFPERFMDVGIAEQHAVTCAAGMATQGIVPVVAIYSTFLQRAYDQIIHDVCLPNLHVIFALDRGGLVGQDGATHQGQFDISFLRLIPNMTLMAPKDENELRRMLLTAVKHDGPVALRYTRGQGEGVELDEPVTPIAVGEAEILSSGSDLLILAIGNMVWPALRAAQRARQEGVEAGVINMRFIKPLDEELLKKALSETNAVLTVEENTLLGGMGSAVLEFMAQAGIQNKRVHRMGLPDMFIEHGPQNVLRREYELDEEAIYENIKKLTGGYHRAERASRQVARS